MSFGLISDTHNHAWAQFATTLDDGLNSRLVATLEETKHAAYNLYMDGVRTLIHAGDMFHVRGSVAPSVLNPTLDAYRYITRDLGMRTLVIPGNHDLETNDSTLMTNASTALRDLGIVIASEPNVYHVGGDSVFMVPWQSSVAKLKEIIEAGADKDTYLVMHAPVNGVILGIPDHGIDASYLQALGYKGVFSGHYHNRKDFGKNVWSIGALTHQTWGDVGSECGYLKVSGDVVTHYDTNAPRFVDFNLETHFTETEYKAMYAGNYVRAKLPIDKESEIATFKKSILDFGAAGVTVIPVRKSKTAARTASVKAGASVEASVTEFIDMQGYKQKEKLNEICHGILSLASAE